jgi:hypothetical protein
MANPFGSGEMTPELIENVVNVLSNIPDYIRKLDKKRISTEKSLDARKKKLQYLEDEVRRFVTKFLHTKQMMLIGCSPD